MIERRIIQRKCSIVTHTDLIVGRQYLQKENAGRKPVINGRLYIFQAATQLSLYYKNKK